MKSLLRTTRSIPGQDASPPLDALLLSAFSKLTDLTLETVEIFDWCGFLKERASTVSRLKKLIVPRMHYNNNNKNGTTPNPLLVMPHLQSFGVRFYCNSANLLLHDLGECSRLQKLHLCGELTGRHHGLRWL